MISESQIHKFVEELPVVFGHKGWIEARVKRAGSAKKELIALIPNTLLNAGLAHMAGLMGEKESYDDFGYGAIGTDNTAPQATDTGLGTEVDRQAVTFSRVTTTVSNDTSQFVSTHTAPAGGWNIVEYGLVTISSGGVFFNRVTFSQISLAENDQLEFTYKVKHASA